MLKLRRSYVWLAVALGAISACVFGGLSLSNTIRPAGIVIHHAAIPPLPDGRAVDAALIDEIHRQRGNRIFYWGRFYHGGYHYVILPDGTVQRGLPEHCQGAHAPGYNAYIGICLVGDFSTADNPTGARGLTQPTAAQLNALTNLCRHLKQKYQLPAQSVLRHHDVNPHTECPGDRFPFQELLRSL